MECDSDRPLGVDYKSGPPAAVDYRRLQLYKSDEDASGLRSRRRSCGDENPVCQSNIELLFTPAGESILNMP
eukprot:5795603-Pyramimonas_sp.AAC.1